MLDRIYISVMAGRKQNLILFFEENEDYSVIDSRLVRMYMNRFTIDEDHQPEITAVYDIRNGTWEEYEECFLISLTIERENETENTDTHWIIGSSKIGGKMINYQRYHGGIVESLWSHLWSHMWSHRWGHL